MVEDAADIDAEDPKVIKELIDLIKKVGESVNGEMFKCGSRCSVGKG